VIDLERARDYVARCRRHGEAAVVRTSTSVAQKLLVGTEPTAELPFLSLTAPGPVWLGDGPGHMEAAEVLIAWATLRGLDATVVLTGAARDAGPACIGLTLPDGGDGCWGTHLVGLGFDPSGPPADLEEQVCILADQGDLLEASARWRCLQTVAPERAARTSWVPLERLLRGGRCAEVLQRAMWLDVAPEARSRVLLAVATARYHLGQLGPWMGMLQRLAIDPDPRLRADASVFLAYVRGDLEVAVRANRPSTTWQRALGEASLFEAGQMSVGELSALPGRFAEALRRFFVTEAREEAVGLAVQAGHHRDALMMATGSLHPPDVAEAYRDLVSANVARACVEALESGRAADARRALDGAPLEVRASRDVWANRLSLYEIVVSAVEGDRASLLSALAAAERRMTPSARSRGLKRLWHRLQRCGGSDDPWIEARVAGWVLERLDGAEAFELSTQTLPSLPPRPLALGPYAVEERIGSGGMGQVWRARHVATQQLVAVKVLRRDRVDRDAEAFAAEVELSSRLEHPGIVGVLDVGVVGNAVSLQSRGELAPGQPYLVMEYVVGGTLEGHIGCLGFEALRAVALALLDALAYAHARGVLHRDLKPENVLVTSTGAVRLSDFGLSAYRSDRAAGTPYYMAPEQFRGAELSPRTDLYGLGCMLWHVVSGVPLFTGTLRAIRDGHLDVSRPPLVAQVDVPRELEGWLHRLVAAAPSYRFASAQEAAHALRGLGGPTLPGRGGPRLPGMPTSSTTFILETVLDGAEPAEPLPAASASLPAHWVGVGGWAGRPRVPSDRMVDRGDPRLVAHAEAMQVLWQALREVQSTGARRDLVVDAPWGSRQLMADELRLAARHHGARVEEEARAGALAVVDGPVDTSAQGPWLVLTRGKGPGAVTAPRASVVDLLETAGRRLPLDLATAGSAALRAWGHPALVGAALQAWSLDPGYRVGSGGLGLVGPPHEHTALEAWWARSVERLSPPARQLLALAAFFDDGTPRGAVASMESTAGFTLADLGAVARWRDGRLFLPADLRRVLRRRHARDAESFHAVLADLFAADEEGLARAEGHRLRAGTEGGPRRWVERVLRPAYTEGSPAWPSEALGHEAWLAFDQHLDAAPDHRAWVRLLLHHRSMRRQPGASDRALAELSEGHPEVAPYADAVRWWARVAGLVQGEVPTTSVVPLPMTMALRAGWAWQQSRVDEAMGWAEQALAAAHTERERARVCGVMGRLLAGREERMAWLATAAEGLPAGRERARSLASMGWAHLASGRLDAADGVAQEALADDPSHVGARLLGAWGAWHRGDDPRQHLLRALEASLGDGRVDLAGQAITGLLWAEPGMRSSRREVLRRWACPVPAMLGTLAPERAAAAVKRAPDLGGLVLP